MEPTTDDQIAVPFVTAIGVRFPEIHSVSFDKGFHSPANQRQLPQVVALPVLPKKGKRSAAEWEREHDSRFIRLRQRHSAVESAINALEAHGLDLCPDHGLDGFKRSVAMAVVARNVHHLGAILLAAEAEQERRRQRRAA